MKRTDSSRSSITSSFWQNPSHVLRFITTAALCTMYRTAHTELSLKARKSRTSGRKANWQSYSLKTDGAPSSKAAEKPKREVAFWIVDRFTHPHKEDQQAGRFHYREYPKYCNSYRGNKQAEQRTVREQTKISQSTKRRTCHKEWRRRE